MTGHIYYEVTFNAICYVLKSILSSVYESHF